MSVQVSIDSVETTLRQEPGLCVAQIAARLGVKASAVYPATRILVLSGRIICVDGSWPRAFVLTSELADTGTVSVDRRDAVLSLHILRDGLARGWLGAPSRAAADRLADRLGLGHVQDSEVSP